jgi:hypothetical protein
VPLPVYSKWIATHVNLDFERPTLFKSLFIRITFIRLEKAGAKRTCSIPFKYPPNSGPRNARDIEAMLESTMNEVIDSFIPWRQISKSYFTAPAPAPAPVPAPARSCSTKPCTDFRKKMRYMNSKPMTKKNSNMIAILRRSSKTKVRWEEVKINLDEEEVNTEDELDQKLKESENYLVKYLKLVPLPLNKDGYANYRNYRRGPSWPLSFFYTFMIDVQNSNLLIL